MSFKTYLLTFDVFFDMQSITNEFPILWYLFNYDLILSSMTIIV